jgi:hypothetical protein
MASNQLTWPGNGSLSGKQYEQSLLAVSPSLVLGWEGIYLWKTLEDGSAGSYDFSTIIQDYNAVTGWNGSSHVKPRRFMIMVWAQDFAHTDPTASLPSYITSNSAYGPGADGSHYGYWPLGNYGSSAAIWRPAVMSRIQALFAALANTKLPDGYTFDTSPYVEAVMFQETSLSLANGSDYSDSTMAAQWQSLNGSMASAFPHTNIVCQANYMQNASTTYSLVQSFPGTRTALGSPDVSGGPTTVADYGGLTWGQGAYAGYQPNSSGAWMSGGTDLRASLAGIFNVQQPDLDSYAPSALFTQANSTLQSTHVVWTVLMGDTNASNWLGSAGDPSSWSTASGGVLAMLVNSTLSRTGCPSSYSGSGGCNTN